MTRPRDGIWSVQAVGAEAVRPLREQVLRPGQSDEQLAYAADEASDTLHAAVIVEGQIVAVGSIAREGHPLDPRWGDWRVRGMASSPQMRGRGIGGALLGELERHAQQLDGARVWCNARVGARSFYERAGFAVEGERFEIPEIGMHHLMSKALQSSEPARSFGRVAAEYERGRPGYPREAIDWLLGAEPMDVLDVGAGTGKLTAAVLEAGHRVSAVEPLDEMRAILAERLPVALALRGAAEQLPIPDGSVDAVVVGAAFHWFDQEAALAEIARVLRPPGILGLLGNSFDVSVAWVARMRELLGPPAIERKGHWPSLEELGARFAEVEVREFAHEQLVDRESLRDLACSRSAIALMGEAEREALLARLDLLWEQEPELSGQSSAILQWRARVGRCRGLLASAEQR